MADQIDQQQNAVSLSPELVMQLRAVRDLLMEQYHAHQSGVALSLEHPLSKLRQTLSEDSANATLPPEQSLALRSQISYITQIVEPGTQEMWPDYSPDEKKYLETQSLERARGLNHVAMAALGPFAMPAMAADKANAPPEVVSNLIEMGFNATALLGLGRHGARHSNVAEPVPPELMESTANPLKLVVSKPLGPPFLAQYNDQPLYKMIPKITEVFPDSQAKNNGHYDASASVTHIRDFHNWRVSARKYYDAALKSGQEAEPILDWLKEPQLETLGLALHPYGNGRGQLLADMRSIKEGPDHSIDGLLEHYRTSKFGRSEAYQQVYDFERRLINDIAGRNAELDPTNLRLVVGKLNAGQYMTASDYAALEYVRDLAHQEFVGSKLETYRDANKYMRLTDEELQKNMQALRQQAEASSPYAHRNKPHEPDPPHDHTPEL